MARKVNVQPGKQGFQPTTHGSTPPTAATRPLGYPVTPDSDGPGGAADIAAMYAKLEENAGKPLRGEDLDFLQAQDDYCFAIEDSLDPEIASSDPDVLDRLRTCGTLFAQTPRGRVSIREDIDVITANGYNPAAKAVLEEVLAQYH